MLSHEDNERLTRIGRGTPMGEVFRRYWLPALLSTEVVSDGSPVRVKLLGENLIAFRNTGGEAGIVDAFCPHRRGPMFFGRNERGGLRCVYHGWKFAPGGECLDMPTEPKDSSYKSRIRIKSYPCFESGGMLWTYMGPPDQPPSRPDFELLRAPPTHRAVSRTVQDCNYLQALEGGLDSSHATILHNITIGDLGFLDDYERTTPKLNVHLKEYGFQYSGMRAAGSRHWVRVYQYIMPATQLRARTVPVRGETAPPRVPLISGHFWIPNDDVTTTVFNFSYSADPAIELDQQFWRAAEADYGRGPDDMLPDFRLKKNLANNYMIDRELQRTRSFTGITGINTQDVAIQEGMGPIADRSEEHLGSTDRAITAVRRLLMDATRSVAAGGTLRGIDPATYRDVRAVDHYADSEADIPAVIAREVQARY
ncbi:MAG TPA: Rieske 2Fe-2S domain-containing protein [Micropepsaceae bacterium]|nr:Rieske 2Fe-2S domain-containing protein [Micropepsaceae bacterium]